MLRVGDGHGLLCIVGICSIGFRDRNRIIGDAVNLLANRDGLFIINRLENSLIVNGTFDYAVLVGRLVPAVVILSGQAQEAEIHTIMILLNLCVSLVPVWNSCPERFRCLVNMAALQLHINRGRMLRHWAVVSVPPLLCAGNIQRILHAVGESDRCLICAGPANGTTHGVVGHDFAIITAAGNADVHQLRAILGCHFFDCEAGAYGDTFKFFAFSRFQIEFPRDFLIAQCVAANVSEADLKMVRSLQVLAVFGLLLFNGQAAGFDRVDKHDLQLGLAVCFRSVGVRVGAENDGFIVWFFSVVTIAALRVAAFGVLIFNTSIIRGSAGLIFEIFRSAIKR